jgi:hypothetical protein
MHPTSHTRAKPSNVQRSSKHEGRSAQHPDSRSPDAQQTNVHIPYEACIAEAVQSSEVTGQTCTVYAFDTVSTSPRIRNDSTLQLTHSVPRSTVYGSAQSGTPQLHGMYDRSGVGGLIAMYRNVSQVIAMYRNISPYRHIGMGMPIWYMWTDARVPSRRSA